MANDTETNALPASAPDLNDVTGRKMIEGLRILARVIARAEKESEAATGDSDLHIPGLGLPPARG